MTTYGNSGLKSPAWNPLHLLKAQRLSFLVEVDKTVEAKYVRAIPADTLVAD